MSEYHDPDFLSDLAEADRKEMEDYCSEYEAEAQWERDQELAAMRKAEAVERD